MYIVVYFCFITRRKFEVPEGLQISVSLPQVSKGWEPLVWCVSRCKWQTDARSEVHFVSPHDNPRPSTRETDSSFDWRTFLTVGGLSLLLVPYGRCFCVVFIKQSRKDPPRTVKMNGLKTVWWNIITSMDDRTIPRTWSFRYPAIVPLHCFCVLCTVHLRVLAIDENKWLACYDYDRRWLQYFLAL